MYLVPLLPYKKPIMSKFIHNNLSTTNWNSFSEICRAVNSHLLQSSSLQPCHQTAEILAKVLWGHTLFGKQAKSSKRVENSMSWIFMKLIWGVHMHLLYHVQCTKTIFIAWFGCRSSESTTKFTRSGRIYLMKLAYCSKSLLTSQIRQKFNSSVS